MIVPGEVGSFGIYPQHASLIASMDVGILQIRLLDVSISIVKMVVDGGFVEVKNGTVNILADSADTVDSINFSSCESQLEELLKQPPSLQKVKEIKKAKTRILLKQS